MHAESTEDKLIDAINKEPKYTPAPQVEMVSDEMVNAALSEYHPMRAIYYPQEEIKAALQAALNARAGGDDSARLAKHHASAVSDDFTKIAGGHFSHDEVARKVRMLLRTDLDHEAVCQIGRDRIVWLARKLAAQESAFAELLETLRLADAMLSGANMDAKFVENKVRTALASQAVGVG